jgi:hypothetical protein
MCVTPFVLAKLNNTISLFWTDKSFQALAEKDGSGGTFGSYIILRGRGRSLAKFRKR